MGKRSRKRSGPPARPAARAPAPAAKGAATTTTRPAVKATAAAKAPRAAHGAKAARRSAAARKPSRWIPPDRGDRPPALWGRAPISELSILAGTIVLVVGMSRGSGRGTPAIIGGLVLIGFASAEFALREHLRGYRSHAIFLAILLTAGVHLAVALIGGTGAAQSPITIAVDLAVLAALFTGFSRLYAMVRVDKPRTRSR